MLEAVEMDTTTQQLNTEDGFRFCSAQSSWYLRKPASWQWSHPPGQRPVFHADSSMSRIWQTTGGSWGVWPQSCSCDSKGAGLQAQFTSLGGASADCTGAGWVQPHLLLPVWEEFADTMTADLWVTGFSSLDTCWMLSSDNSVIVEKIISKYLK